MPAKSKEEQEEIIDLTPAGPGAIAEQTISPDPLLAGAEAYEYVTIINPLSVDFVAKFGVTRPVNAPLRIVNDPNTPSLTKTEEQIAANYGLNLRNPNTQGKANIINKTRIPAGKTITVPGNEAQVIVNQLVTEMMQREGKRLQLSDMFTRNTYEQRIIVSRGSMDEVMQRINRPLNTVSAQVEDALKEANSGEETEFPGATSEVTGADQPISESTKESAKRGPGRPKNKPDQTL